MADDLQQTLSMSRNAPDSIQPPALAEDPGNATSPRRMKSLQTTSVGARNTQAADIIVPDAARATEGMAGTSIAATASTMHSHRCCNLCNVVNREEAACACACIDQTPVCAADGTKRFVGPGYENFGVLYDDMLSDLEDLKAYIHTGRHPKLDLCKTRTRMSRAESGMSQRLSNAGSFRSSALGSTNGDVS